MPLVNTNLNTTVMTADQKLTARVNQFTALLNQQYAANLQLFNALVALVWLNPDWTPQQVFDKFGTNAGDLCKLSDAFLAMVNLYTGQSLSIVPASFTLTINTDGTVTVTSNS